MFKQEDGESERFYKLLRQPRFVELIKEIAQEDQDRESQRLYESLKPKFVELITNVVQNTLPELKDELQAIFRCLKDATTELQKAREDSSPPGPARRNKRIKTVLEDKSTKDTSVDE